MDQIQDKENTWSAMAMELIFGNLAQSMKANGRTIALMVKVFFGILKETFILDSFNQIKRMDSEFMYMPMAQDTKVNGVRMCRKVMVRSCGATALASSAHIKKA